MVCWSSSRKKIIACIRFAIVAKTSAPLFVVCIVCWSAQAAHATPFSGAAGAALLENVCFLTDGDLKIQKIVLQETSPVPAKRFGVPSIAINKLSELSLAITTYRMAALLARALAQERRTLGAVIIGTASMYNPLHPGYKEGGVETASGEPYDAAAWTCLCPLELSHYRCASGRVQYGSEAVFGRGLSEDFTTG
jgi:hypothetical protein